MNSRQARLIFFLFIAVIVYRNSINNGFTWDDEYLILRNDHIKDISSIQDLFLDQSTQTISSGMRWYRPIRSAVYAVEYSIFGRKAQGYHLVNLLIHLANIIIINLFLKKATDAQHADIVSILFAVHPIMTESVSSITGLADIMCATFLLLTLLGYISLKGFYNLALTSILFFLALLSKEMAVTYPLLLTILFFFYGKEPNKGERVKPFLYILSVYLTILSVYIGIWLYLVGGFSKSTPYGGSYYSNLLMALKVFSVYLRLLLFPINQSVRYDMPNIYSISDPRAILSLSLFITSFLVMILSYRRYKYLSFGCAWFFITLIPVSNIIPLDGSMTGERFLYIPSIGFFIAFSDILLNIFKGCHEKISRHFSYIIKVGSLTILSLFFSFLTMKRNHIWKDNIALFSDAVLKAPDSLAVRLNLVSEYRKAGEIRLARFHYEEAKRINILNVRLHILWGKMQFAKGRIDKAEQEFIKAVDTNPNIPLPYIELARFYEKIGMPYKAYMQWLDLLKIDTNNKTAKAAVKRLRNF